MAFDGISLTEINLRIADSVEEDQSACMCRLILLHPVLKIDPWLQKGG